MIDRRDPTRQHPGVLGAGQAISLDAALPLFPANGARALGLQEETGAIRVGLSADLVVIRGDIDAMSPEDIGAVVPHATLYGGRVVHGAL